MKTRWWRTVSPRRLARPEWRSLWVSEAAFHLSCCLPTNCLTSDAKPSIRPYTFSSVASTCPASAAVSLSVDSQQTSCQQRRGGGSVRGCRAHRAWWRGRRSAPPAGAPPRPAWSRAARSPPPASSSPAAWSAAHPPPPPPPDRARPPRISPRGPPPPGRTRGGRRACARAPTGPAAPAPPAPRAPRAAPAAARRPRPTEPARSAPPALRTPPRSWRAGAPPSR